jgi:hypothetical protein
LVGIHNIDYLINCGKPFDPVKSLVSRYLRHTNTAALKEYLVSVGTKRTGQKHDGYLPSTISTPNKTIDTPHASMAQPSNPPRPPPLPPTHHSPSSYEVKLRSALPDYLSNIPNAQYQALVYQPVYYFFYGTLTRPGTLKRILDLKEEPVLRRAQIVGYSLANWGDYLTLLDGPPDNVISGYAYMVQSDDDEQKLAHYETLAYKAAPCLITFTDGVQQVQAMGRTFIYAGDPAALKEKRFDRKLWARQMGQGSISYSNRYG